MTPLRSALLQLLADHPVPEDAMQAAIGCLMDGQSSEVEIAAFLTALRCRGETVDELVGAARAMRDRSTKIPCQALGRLDTCGTGGDELQTFNISTAAALVAAAAGVPVAKHGNRSVSSLSGSADVLEALGVNLALTPGQVALCVDEIGIGFCFAPLLHGAMKHAAPVRKQLGFRTIFNFLGPLTNPAGADFQLVGAGSDERAAQLAEALSRLGARRALVVCGNNQLDEISLWGSTRAFLVERGNRPAEMVWSPADLGLPACSVAEIQVPSPAASASIIRELLAGTPGAARNMVLANAGAALWIAGRGADVRAGIALAAEAIDSGRAAATLRTLAERSQKLATEGNLDGP